MSPALDPKAARPLARAVCSECGYRLVLPCDVDTYRCPSCDGVIRRAPSAALPAPPDNSGNSA